MHESKYVYWVPRPTQVDPQITLAIGVPNHPSYPSNHACISGAIARVLDTQFPDEHGLYWSMARQAAESRILGGIHYRMASTAAAGGRGDRDLQGGAPNSCLMMGAASAED